MLYNACVTSIKDYAHEAIGFHEYSGSSSLHNRALRLYLGVGNSANLCGIRSDMAWLEPRSRTQIKMFRFYLRMLNMDNNRLTKKIFLHDQKFCSENLDKTCWSTELNQILSRNNLLFSVDASQPKLSVQSLHNSLFNKDLVMFRTKCLAATKLRTYNTLFSPFVPHLSTVKYTRSCLPFILRKRLAQLRLGVLPLKIETDRFLKIPANQRFCIQPQCTNQNHENKPIDDEYHFLLHCNQYSELRQHLYSNVAAPNFKHFSDKDKFLYLLTNASVARQVGQFISTAFDARPCK